MKKGHKRDCNLGTGEIWHKNKNAFSGQTKGDRTILRPIGDHFEADRRIEPRDCPHRGAGFRKSTQRRIPRYCLSKSHLQYIFEKFWANSLANSVGCGLIIARRHAGTDLGGTLRRTGGRPFKGKLKTRFPAKLREIGRFGGQMEIILASTCSTRRTLGRTSMNFEAHGEFLQGNDNLSWPTQKKDNFQVTFANTKKCPESGCQRVIQD